MTRAKGQKSQARGWLRPPWPAVMAPFTRVFMKDMEDLPAQTPARSQPQSSGSIVCPCWWSPDSGKGQGPRASPLPLSHLRPASPRPDPAGRAGVQRSGPTPPLCRKPAGSACCVTLGCKVRLCKVKVSHFLPGASPERAAWGHSLPPPAGPGLALARRRSAR